MTPTQRISWKVAGMAGEGIDVTGVMMAKICMHHGMNVFTYREYPSLIRGGHNTHQVHASFEPVSCQEKHIDVLIAFNEEGISLHLDEITDNTIVLCEATQDQFDLQKYQKLKPLTKFFDVPMTVMSREETGHFLSQNIIALGCSVWILGLSLDVLHDVISSQFKKKSEEMVAKNIKALERGYAYGKEHLPQIKPIAEIFPREQILVTGNQAVALGALSAGVQYFAAYPMTPTSDVLHTLAAHQAEYHLVVKHVEDEIAAMNHVIGASYAGVRAMTASATGGYALMVEATSLAAMAETPLVVCVGQRPGPATGLPTWTCQSDLQFIIHAGHGEVPKVVLTPGTLQEHFELTRFAFALAEKHQVVVFVLSDKFALEAYASIPRPAVAYENPRMGFAGEFPKGALPADNSYRRFENTTTGASPRSIPGQSHGLSITNSYEHDEFGYATESAELTNTMNLRRAQKLTQVALEVPQPELLGQADAQITAVSWGSTRLVLEEVMRQLPAGMLNIIHVPCAWPFPAEAFSRLSQSAKKLVIVEENVTGQLEQVIRQETGIVFADHIRRFDGRPFYPDELALQLSQLAGQGDNNV